MAHFGHSSRRRLETCNLDLQRLMEAVVLRRDCSIVCGHRGEEEQTKAFKDGFSKAKFGQSPHNVMPSNAVDVVPYPEIYGSIPAFNELADVIFDEAIKLGIRVKWGHFFKSIDDMPHWELR